MPIYEYECEQCKNITEKWQGITEDPLTTCPECQGLLKKVISKSSFHLKGGGWFADGYSNGKSAPEKASCKETGSDKAAESTETKKTETGSSQAGDTAKQEGSSQSGDTAKQEAGAGA